MKAVALVSGGKDSILSLHLAQCFSVEVVAIAHLTPKGNADETDSYMYQSVGSQVVESMGRECLPKLKYFERQISGDPIDTESIIYSNSFKNDEVEDLYELLELVVEELPCVQGVISGAIASEYQRDRVENCCRRLNLISIAPLWRWSQECLWSYLIDVWRDNIDIRILKAATIGLSSNILMKRLQEASDEILDAYQRYKINVCGEGGEFESLVLDCPGFESKIEINEWTAVQDSNNSSAASLALIKSSNVRTVPKNVIIGCDERSVIEYTTDPIRILHQSLDSLDFYTLDSGIKVSLIMDLSKEFKFSYPLNVNNTLTKCQPRANCLFVHGISQNVIEDAEKVHSYRSASTWVYRSIEGCLASALKLTTTGRVLELSDIFGLVPHDISGKKLPRSFTQIVPSLAYELILCLRSFRNILWDVLDERNARAVMQNSKANISLTFAIEKDLQLNEATISSMMFLINEFYQANRTWAPNSRLQYTHWTNIGITSAQNRIFSLLAPEATILQEGVPWAVHFEEAAFANPVGGTFTLMVDPICIDDV